MTLQITCPGCALAFPMEAGVNDADARRFAILMGRIPPAIAKHIPGYLRLFKPRVQGLRWSRAVIVLDELVPMIEAGQVQRDGRAWAAPSEAWVYALEDMANRANKLDLPLSSHGYLLDIIAGQANRTEAKQEAEAIEQKRYFANRDQDKGDSAQRRDLQSRLSGLKKLNELKPSPELQQQIKELELQLG